MHSPVIPGIARLAAQHTMQTDRAILATGVYRRFVSAHKESPMDEDKFNLSLRKFLKQVGVTSQREIERIVRERGATEGKGPLKVKVLLTAEGTDLRHEVEGSIDLG
jgi:hypothetical protein